MAEQTVIDTPTEHTADQPLLLSLAGTDSWFVAAVVYVVGALGMWAFMWFMGQLAAMEYAGK